MPAFRSRLRALLRRFPGARSLARGLRRRFDRRERVVMKLRRELGDALFQPFPTTAEERYPQLFDALAERLAHVPSPRILSFGCSNGAEVRALRRRMPHARITGIDANPQMIAAAISADPTGDYRVGTAPSADDRFDAILAMAVFRHGELEADRPHSCAAVFPFARYAGGVAMLDACLVPGGWYAQWYAHFCFGDTPTGARYVVDPLRMTGRKPLDLLWDRQDRRMDGVTETAVLFRKPSE